MKYMMMHQLSLKIIVDCGITELGKYHKFHKCTKHIDFSYHFVQEQVKLNNIIVKYCSTQDMLANIKTKRHTKVTFKTFRDNLM